MEERRVALDSQRIAVVCLEIRGLDKCKQLPPKLQGNMMGKQHQLMLLHFRKISIRQYDYD